MRQLFARWRLAASVTAAIVAAVGVTLSGPAQQAPAATITPTGPLPVANLLNNASSAQAAGTTSGGDFIVRCFFNGNTAAMDPIMDPGSSTSDHMHVFFGNLIQGTSSFPTIKSGDGGGNGTMETGSSGLRQQTNCQDEFDTAGYWQPEPYVNGTPWLGPDGTGCQANCNPGNTMHLRVYYLPNAVPSGGGSLQQEIPDGSIMVAGFPDGCAGVTGHGCSGGSGYPDDLNIVRYDCGADNKVGVVTPASAWPYNCNLYKTDSDDTFNDGIVAFVDFPDCWNGHADWSTPNDPTGPKVPGYVAPWIPDPNAPTSMGQRLNDFTYVTPGSTCPSGFPIAVVQLEERFHLLTSGPTGTAGFGEPSTCSNEGVNWNSSTDNTEWTDGGPAPHTCVAAQSPSDNINLSFACTPKSQGGDPNCTVDTGVTGCGSSSGHCFIGASPHGWETFHADYWQTWQEGIGDVQGNGTDNGADPSQGSFRDLIEDCSNEIPAAFPPACSFINTATQTPSGRVFGNPENT
jgi:hypothetical protein